MGKPKTVNKVLVGGVFDILHYGHISFLKKAKSLGNYLIVAIESDENVKRLKGDGRPIHSQTQRKEILESLKFVDEVIILKDKMTDDDYVEMVKKVHPAIIATTKNDPIAEKKLAQAKSVGARFVEIPKFRSHSTSMIVKLLEDDPTS
jgi:rfaE bifunctional protein nucleotidyltransferase chain/domain